MNVTNVSQHFPGFIYKYAGPNSLLSFSHANLYCVCLKVNFLQCWHFIFVDNVCYIPFQSAMAEDEMWLRWGLRGRYIEDIGVRYVTGSNESRKCGWKQGWKIQSSLVSQGIYEWNSNMSEGTGMRKGTAPWQSSHASGISAVAVAAVADLGCTIMVILKKNELWVYVTRLWSSLFREAKTVRGWISLEGNGT